MAKLQLPTAVEGVEVGSEKQYNAGVKTVWRHIKSKNYEWTWCRMEIMSENKSYVFYRGIFLKENN